MKQWSRSEPGEKIVDMLGLVVTKDIPLEEAVKAYLASDKIVYPSKVEQSIDNIFKRLDKRRKIGSFTVKDATHLFESIVKDQDEAYAFRARAVLANVIRFGVMGDVPPRKNDNTDESPDVGKLDYQKIKTSEALKLVPLFNMMGRYSQIKAEVQELIGSLGPDESGMLPVRTKKKMDQKEATGIMIAIQKFFNQNNIEFVIKYNPARFAFLLLRTPDLSKHLKSKHGGK